MTRVLALDLSLNATGIFCGDPEDPQASYTVEEIGTPARRVNENDVRWNARRYRAFSLSLLDVFRTLQPELVVIEVTSHAHQWMTRGRGSEKTRMATSRGTEFRAGLGLGRAMGWVDGTLVMAEAYGCAPPRVETIEARDAKQKVTGLQGASKEGVSVALEKLFGWATDGWKESQVDALAAGLGYLRLEAQLEQEAKIQAVAERQTRRKPRGRQILQEMQEDAQREVLGAVQE